jgi:hypothetical protein
LHGKVKAAELWDRHNLSIPVDLQRLVSELGLEVVAFPFRGRLKEVIIDGVIGVRPGLPRPWLRWLVAHAIGHYVLHVGTSFYLESWQWVNHARDERQAEEFAAWLLGGPQGWRHTPEELGIPREKLMLVQLLADQGGILGLEYPE